MRFKQYGSDKKELGWVYLLHFDRPFGHAKHYTGWTNNLEHRLGEHMDGDVHSANIVRKAAAVGIGFSVARIWDNMTRTDERKLKNRGGASRHCPLCKEDPCKKSAQQISK